MPATQVTGQLIKDQDVATADIVNDAITFAKMQNIATDRLIGRDTAATGDPEEISVSGGLEWTGSAGIQRSALTGDVTAAAGSNATTLVQASGAFAFTGDITPPQITAATNDYNPTGMSTALVLRLDTDALRVITGFTGGSDGRILIIHYIGAFQLGLKSESNGSTAANRMKFYDTSINTRILDPGDTAILQYDATASRWRMIGLCGGNGWIEPRSLFVSSTNRLLGIDTGSAVQELTATGGLEFTGSGGIRRSALTGDVTATAGSNATTIANDAVTYAKIQNVSATSRLLGRGSAGAGDIEELIAGGGVEFNLVGTGIQRSALTGDATATAGSGATKVKSASEDFALTGVITPTAISADQHNYNPTGWATCSVVRLDATANWTFTGFTAPTTAGTLKLIVNIAASASLFFVPQNGGSTATNQFSFPSDYIIMNPGESVLFRYDGVDRFWKPMHPVGRLFGPSAYTTPRSDGDGYLDYTWLGSGVAAGTPDSTLFLRGDKTYQVPCFELAPTQNLNIPTNKSVVMADSLTMNGSLDLTIQGTSTLSIT